MKIEKVGMIKFGLLTEGDTFVDGSENNLRNVNMVIHGSLNDNYVSLDTGLTGHYDNDDIVQKVDCVLWVNGGRV